jgi:hypothetical protein
LRFRYRPPRTTQSRDRKRAGTKPLAPEQVAADRVRLLAALAEAGEAGLTQTEVSADVFARNRRRGELATLLAKLAGDDLVAAERERVPGADRPVIRWRLLPNSSPTCVLEGASPEGAGWVRWSDALAVAESGVPERYALAVGKRVRAREAKRNKTRYPNRRSLSDLQRGTRFVARRSLAEAVRAGTIERSGAWCRLSRDPLRPPSAWMELVYAGLGEEHPTLTGRYEPKGGGPVRRPPARPKTKPKVVPVAVHQLRITLCDVEPRIWRRIQVPSDILLVRLHEVLQAAMGWGDMHLHSFGGRYSAGGYVESYEFTTTLAQFAPDPGWGFSYQYDFGDMWEHDVAVEKVIGAGRRPRYPVCIAGGRACPPEDCGGPPGYWNLVRQTRNRRGDRYYWYRDLYERSFKPDAFDLEEINEELAELAERQEGVRPPER